MTCRPTPLAYAKWEEDFPVEIDRHTAAAWELANVRPTTPVGIIALVDYIERFNDGQVGGWLRPVKADIRARGLAA